VTTRRLSASRILEAGAGAGPVLGIDTGSPTASLGVVADGRIQAALSRRLRSHAAELPDAVEEVLAAAGIAMREVKAIGVAIGPGSFTGLRIGLSYAKGLALVANYGIVCIPTLDAITLCIPPSDFAHHRTVCPILDAHKGEVYTALYQFMSDALQKITRDLCITLTDLASRIEGEVLFIGDSKAEEACSHILRSGGAATVIGNTWLELRGSYVAALGAARLATGEVDDPATLEPLYVRPPDALVNATALRTGEGDYGTSRGRAHPATCRSR